jgi:NAD(P)-dependent dehydrogenase (short-subunit alcohol dehydrogenase family)
MTCDVSDAAQVKAMRERAEAELGGCDLLVNNAGVAAAGLLGEMPLEDWAWVMGVNLWGPIYGCHEFVPLMKRQGAGHILNVASAAAFGQAPRMGPYNVTKAGVVSLSETLASEIGPLGIGVTVLCPYFFETNIMKTSRKTNMAAKTDDHVAREMRAAKQQAQDVARIALAACDDGQLYALPHVQAKAVFAIKRFIPAILHQRIGPALAKRITGQG